MEIVRLENGNVELRDGGVFVWSIPQLPTEIKPIDKDIRDHVKLFQSDGRVEYLHLDEITETQVLPDPAVPFSGDVFDLAALMSSDFFFEVVASPASIDYVQNVALVGGSLDFTGVGLAFSGSVPLTGLDTNFANTDLTLDDNRSHDFDGKYMILNSTGFTSPVSTEPAFILDPLGGLFGTPIVGIKNGILSGINTTLLQQDDGSGLKTAISTQDSVGDVHRLEVNQGSVIISSTNGGDGNLISTDKSNGIEIQVESGNLSIDIPSADAVGKVLTVANSSSKEVEFTDSSSFSAVTISATPPADTAKLWFNQTDSVLYFYDGSDWISEQLFEVTFNDQGNTPNNTFFRAGNTVTNDLGIGYVLEIDARLVGLSFARLPGTAALGNYWLYSNSVTGTNIASVVGVFTVDASARGYVGPNTPTDINAGSYVNIRWNGAQTNNNIVSLKYRKKYV